MAASDFIPPGELVRPEISREVQGRQLQHSMRQPCQPVPGNGVYLYLPQGLQRHGGGSSAKGPLVGAGLNRRGPVRLLHVQCGHAVLRLALCCRIQGGVQDSTDEAEGAVRQEPDSNLADPRGRGHFVHGGRPGVWVHLRVQRPDSRPARAPEDPGGQLDGLSDVIHLHILHSARPHVELLLP